MRKDRRSKMTTLGLTLVALSALGCGDDKGSAKGSAGDLNGHDQDGSTHEVAPTIDAALPAAAVDAAPAVVPPDAGEETPSCADQVCVDGMHCELVQVQCVRAPCPPQPSCVADLDACAAVRCASGTHCATHQVQCFVAPCNPVAECVAN